MEKERDSGIELLRIFASMLVIMLHFNLSGAINCSLGTNRLLLYGLESLGICAVDLFLIITGYFSAHSTLLNMYVKKLYNLTYLVVSRGKDEQT